MNTIPLSWTQLATLTNFKLDRVNGDTEIITPGVPTVRKFGYGWKSNKFPIVLKK